MKTYLPRYPTRNAGFVFLAISLALSIAPLAFFVTVIANQHRRGEVGEGSFNWLFLAITVVVSLILFWLGLVGARRILKNEPRRVSLDKERILIESAPNKGQAPIKEVEIPFTELISVDQEDKLVADETAKGGVRYKGLLFQWQPNNAAEVQAYRLSERDVTEFDQLIDDIFAQIPVTARGQRIFDR